MQENDNFNKSSKYTSVKKADRVEIDALLGLTYFRGMLGVNLHMTDRLFSNDSYFHFGTIMSKTYFRFLKGHICFDRRKNSCGKQIDSQLLERSGKSSTQIFQSMLHQRNTFQLIRRYTQWENKLPSASIVPIRHIAMVFYWIHSMIQDFLIHTKLYLILQNQKLEMFCII